MRNSLWQRVQSVIVGLGFIFLTLVSGGVHADSLPPAPPVQKTQMTSVRRNIATVMFFGIGGAVLGLSTLSFYPNPSQNLGNITTGLAIGLVGGLAYVASDAWSSPSPVQASDLYREFQARDTRPKPVLAQVHFEF